MRIPALVSEAIPLGDQPDVWQYWVVGHAVALPLALVLAVIIPIIVLDLIGGFIALIGGLFTVKRRKWGLSLAASIFSLLIFSFTLSQIAESPLLLGGSTATLDVVGLLLGITTIVLTVMSKKDFRTSIAEKQESG
jgi:hypothetical protein